MRVTESFSRDFRDGFQFISQVSILNLIDLNKCNFKFTNEMSPLRKPTYKQTVDSTFQISNRFLLKNSILNTKTGYGSV